MERLGGVGAVQGAGDELDGRGGGGGRGAGGGAQRRVGRLASGPPLTPAEGPETPRKAAWVVSNSALQFLTARKFFSDPFRGVC